jgi:4-hydroxy-2-oxoglutarate aldolase
MQVADHSSIPVLIYNFPTVTAGLNLSSDIIGELAQHSNVVGTKLSCGDIGKLTRLSTIYRPHGEGAKKYGDFATFPGKSDVYLPSLLMYSYGIIGALVNLAPKLHTKIFRLFNEGKVEEALAIQEIVSHADAAISSVGGIGGLKKSINEYFGYGDGFVRGPLAVATHEKITQGTAGHWIRKCVELEKSVTL